VDPLAGTLLSSWLATADLPSTAVIALLLAARLIPLVTLTPWLRVPGSEWLVTGCVAAALWVAFLPQAVAGVLSPLPSGLALGLAIVREMLVGSIFAVVASLPLVALGWTGGLAGHAAGDRSWHNLADAPLPTLYRWLGLVLFVTFGGAEFALEAVADGLLQLPVGGLLVWLSARDVAFGFVSLCASAVALGLALAMPVVLGVFVLDLTQAVVSRWLAQWASAQLWLPLKHTAAVALALLSLSMAASTLPDVYTASIAQARSLLIGLTP